MPVFRHVGTPKDPLLERAERVKVDGLTSVVVACYGQLSLTRGLAASLQEHAGCDYELILVDNGCPERTADWAEGAGIRVVRMGENAGVPRAYNAGVAAARGQWIALWNNDMVCHPGGLRRLVQASELRGMAAQTGGCWNKHGRYAGPTAQRSMADYAEGYCLTFSRDVWDEVGPWDEGFFPSWCDDVDWCLRARLCGYDFTLVPDVVTHFGQGSSGGRDWSQTIRAHQQLIEERYLFQGLGRRILVKRWGAAGDLIMLTPALRELQARFPLARIHVQCHSGCGTVLDGLPYVAQRSESADESLFNEVHDLGMPGPGGMLVNAAYEDLQRVGIFRHPALAYSHRLGVPFTSGFYDFRYDPELDHWAAELLPQAGTYVAAGVRSGLRPKQNWRASGWRELLDALPENVRLVLLDSQAQPPWTGRGDDDAELYRHPRAIDLTGKTPTLQHCAALLKRCRAFVGVESGLQHVAHALELPLVVLSAAAPARARLPLLDNGVVGFGGKAPCFPCQYETKCPDRHCLDYVTGTEVAARLLELL